MRVGEVVDFYRTESSQPLAAIIVSTNPNGTVNLNVFSPDSAGLAFVAKVEIGPKPEGCCAVPHYCPTIDEVANESVHPSSMNELLQKQCDEPSVTADEAESDPVGVNTPQEKNEIEF